MSAASSAYAGSISTGTPSATFTPASASQRRHFACMSALHVAGESDPSAFFTGENSSFWSKARNAARRALGSHERDLLERKVERHRLPGLALEERAVEDVDRGRAVEEVERTVLRAAVALLVRHLRILDHAERVAEAHRHADLLLRVALRAELEGVVGLLHDVVADERGVRDLDERIVDLEEEHGLYPAPLHVGERAGALERGEEPAGRARRSA